MLLDYLTDALDRVFAVAQHEVWREQRSGERRKSSNMYTSHNEDHPDMKTITLEQHEVPAIRALHVEFSVR